MSDPHAPDELSALVARARAALDRPADAAPAVVAAAEEAVFAGSSADGQVRAEVDARGTVRTLVIDEAAHRAGTAEIAAAARTAINAALDARPAAPDLSPLVDEVRAAQDYARRTLGQVTDRMAEVALHVRQARGGTA